MLWPITIYHHLNSIPIWHNVGPSIYQNKIWPRTTRNNGRLPLQCSFLQAIVKRLKEERMGFDNQLAGIERTLKACHWEMVGIRYWKISIDLLKSGLWYLASLLDFSLASRQRSGTMKSFFCCPMMLTTPRRGVSLEGWFRANATIESFLKLENGYFWRMGIQFVAMLPPPGWRLTPESGLFCRSDVAGFHSLRVSPKCIQYDKFPRPATRCSTTCFPNGTRRWHRQSWEPQKK